MKRLSLLLIVLSVFFCAASSASAQTYPLGYANAAVKVEYFRFMDDSIRELNAGDGIYVGVEAYKQLFLPNLYLGAQIGWAGSSGDVTVPLYLGQAGPTLNFTTDVSYVPIEFNAKYAIPLDPSLTLDFGSGFSINYFDVSVKENNIFRTSGSNDDWVMGGQFFADLNYKYANWLFGVGIKYQLTDNMTLGGVGTDTGADNLRLGVQTGFSF